MRKNNGDRKELKGLYAVYNVSGQNLERFIEIAKKRGVFLFDVKKLSNKHLQITLNFKDNKKIFAIAEEMCYNIKRIRYKGKSYPLFALFKSVGMLIGALIFIVGAVAMDDFVLSFSFSGSGTQYKNQVIEYLSEQGVRQFSRFSQLDLAVLEDKILSSFDKFSFASCKKAGNRLLIELALAGENTEILSGNVYQLCSDAEGVVEKIKVYRGTAVVSVGDSVKKGDLLVEGIATIKEQTLKINVIASVTLTCSAEYLYRSKEDGQQKMAEILAEEWLGEREISFLSTKKEKIGDEYYYYVSIKYRRILSVG